MKNNNNYTCLLPFLLPFIIIPIQLGLFRLACHMHTWEHVPVAKGKFHWNFLSNNLEDSTFSWQRGRHSLCLVNPVLSFVSAVHVLTQLRPQCSASRVMPLPFHISNSFFILRKPLKKISRLIIRETNSIKV